MSNNHKKIVKQISIFEMIQQDSKPKEIIKSGSLNFYEEFTDILSRCFSNSGLDVVPFAGKMTEKLNRGLPGDPIITPDKVRSWTSIAKIKYGPKAWFLPAFCEVARSYEPIEFLVRKVHRYMMPGPDALKTKIYENQEKIKELQKTNEIYSLYLDEMKNKK